MGVLILLRLLSFLFWPLIIIAFVVWRKKRSMHSAIDQEDRLQIAFSKEDAVSQCFIIVSIFFFGVTLFAFNKYFGDPFSGQTILFVTSVICLASAYRLKILYSLPFGLIGIVSWWNIQASEWIEGKDIKTSVILACLGVLILLFYALGRLHEKDIKWKRFALVYSVLGIMQITGILFFFSTRYGLIAFGKMTKGVTFLSSWQIILSLCIFLISLVGVLLYTKNRKLIFPFEFFAVSLLTLLFVVIALLPQQTMLIQVSNDVQALSSSDILWTIVFNAAIFFELLGLIYLGYLRREAWLINMGAFLFFFLIVVKYCDWFFAFLDKSVFFIIAGILLFVIGWFMEKGRRYMISGIKMQSQQIAQ